MLGCRAADTSMETNAKLLPHQGKDLDNQDAYRRLDGKYNYWIVTKSDISFALSIVDQFL